MVRERIAATGIELKRLMTMLTFPVVRHGIGVGILLD